MLLSEPCERQQNHKNFCYVTADRHHSTVFVTDTMSLLFTQFMTK